MGIITKLFKKKKTKVKYDCICEMVHAESIKHPDKIITGFCFKHKTDWG